MGEYSIEQRNQLSRVIANNGTRGRQSKEIINNRNYFAGQITSDAIQLTKEAIQRDLHPAIKQNLLTIKDNQIFSRSVSLDEATQIRKAGTLVQIIASGGKPSRKCIWISKSGGGSGLAKRSGDPRVALTFKMDGTKTWFVSKIIDNEESDGKETGHEDNIIAKGNEPGNYGIGLNLKNKFALQ